MEKVFICLYDRPLIKIKHIHLYVYKKIIFIIFFMKFLIIKKFLFLKYYLRIKDSYFIK